MEEKREGTPNPLNPDLESDAPRTDTSELTDEKEMKPETKAQSIKVVDVSEDETKEPDGDEGFKPPVELVDEVGDEEITEIETEGPTEGAVEEPVNDEAKKPVEDVAEASAENETTELEESDSKTGTKINVVKVESEEEVLAEPTSEESAYQPPQEVETHDTKTDSATSVPAVEDDSFASLQDTPKQAPVIDMVKPTQPTELVEEDLTLEEDYVTDPAVDQSGIMAGMGAAMVSSQANLDPTNRPMEKASVITQPPKKNRKKTGLIIGMVVSLFIAVGCGVAAVLIFMNGGKEDPVAIAMSRLANGESPRNVSLDGTIEIEMEDQTSPFSDLKIELKGEMITTSMVNSLSAELTANYRDGGDSMTFWLDEAYAAGGDLYFKIDGGKDMPVEVESVSAEEMFVNTDGAETTEAEAIAETEIASDEVESLPLVSAFGILDTINGEWIRVPMESLGELADDDITGGSLGCATSLTSGIRNNGNTVASIYNKHPFVISADQQTTITSAGNPVYRVVVDADSLADFTHELQGTNALSDWVSCVGYKDADAAIEGLIEDAENLPEIYAEIDDEYNFTRIYVKTEVRGEKDCCPDGAECVRACDDESKATVTVDLNFAYPSNVTVSEPVEYKDISDVLQGIFSEMFIVEGTEENGDNGAVENNTENGETSAENTNSQG